MNRGVEIESSVADGPQSVIRQQVTRRRRDPHGGAEAVTEGVRRLRQRA